MSEDGPTPEELARAIDPDVIGVDDRPIEEHLVAFAERWERIRVEPYRAAARTVTECIVEQLDALADLTDRIADAREDTHVRDSSEFKVDEVLR